MPEGRIYLVFRAYCFEFPAEGRQLALFFQIVLFFFCLGGSLKAAGFGDGLPKAGNLALFGFVFSSRRIR
jgi:hypothetical protein